LGWDHIVNILVLEGREGDPYKKKRYYQPGKKEKKKRKDAVG